MAGSPQPRKPWPPQERSGPPRHPPQSISPHTFLDEVRRLLARHGVSVDPGNMNATLRAASWLLLELGVQPDLAPGDHSEASQTIRGLMRMHAAMGTP